MSGRTPLYHSRADVESVALPMAEEMFGEKGAGRVAGLGTRMPL